MFSLRHILRLLVVMLFSALGVSIAFAVPTTATETTFYHTENLLLTQAQYIGFTARAPPLAASNVAITGGVTVMQGSAFALHGQETAAALFGFDGDLNVPNRTVSTEQISRLNDVGRQYYGDLRTQGAPAIDAFNAAKRNMMDVPYAPRVRQRAFEDPGGHNFPRSIDAKMFEVPPVIVRGGGLGYAVQGTATMIYDGVSLAGEVAAARIALKAALTSIKQVDELAFVDDFVPNRGTLVGDSFVPSG